MNWRELLTESDGATPQSNIRNNSETRPTQAGNGGFEDIANTIRVPPPMRPAPRMAPNLALQMAVDAEALFLHLWRRLSNRLSHVMKPGYLLHAQRHEPELWAQREALRMAWDNPQAWIEFKTCAVPWTEYRGHIYQWARLELACIRKHREALQENRNNGIIN